MMKMSKKGFVILSIIVFVIGASGFQSVQEKNKLIATTSFKGDAILGKWEPEENKGAIVLVKRIGNSYDGKLTKSENGKHIGTVILKNLKYDNNTWGGEVYAPEKEELYDVEVTLIHSNRMKLTVSYGFLWKSVYWNKLK